MVSAVTTFYVNTKKLIRENSIKVLERETYIKG